MTSFYAPSINVYSPDPKFVAGVNIKDISFVCIGSSEKDCSLKDPVAYIYLYHHGLLYCLFYLRLFRRNLQLKIGINLAMEFVDLR